MSMPSPNFRISQSSHVEIVPWCCCFFTMYGLIIEGVRFMIVENFGVQVLAQVLEITQLGDKSISTHDIYSEHIVPNLLRAVCEITGMTADQIGVLAGRFFVLFLIRHGYGDLMHVMGRRFSDFLKGLDNIHEYFRFSYPKIRPPSFYCSSESEDGLILHYRSRRPGYISYVIGQLVELARIFYKQELGVKILKKKEKGKFLFVIIQLNFNNTGLSLDNRLKERVKNLNEYLPVDTISFLKMFPFHIAFNRKLDIVMCGQGLLNLMPDIPGQNMIDVFDLQKPCIKFNAEGCLAHENCNFQLESLHPVYKRTQDEITVKINGITEEKVEVESVEKKDDEQTEQNLPYVTLRGPIVYLKGCEMFILLATCVVDGLDDMFRMGLFLNDYGDADCNREIIMASIQKSDHLKNLLQSEKQRSQVLTEMTREISENKRKARQLLTQMMPIEVANTMLRTGRSDQCESFECVTIAFVKVVDFARQTDSMSPVEIVNLLNTIYLIFDEIVDIHGVYKVETIGESYMVSSGVPYRDDFDTVIIADCSLHMIAKMKESDMKFSDGKKVQVKIGIFTGPCVGGIVGAKNPRYCLFGDTVNCASRMELHNKVPMTIQIGQRTKDRLDKQAPNKFKIKHRGVINVKGKGDMKAYEVVGKSGRPRYLTNPPRKPEMEQEDHEEGFDDMDEEHDRTSALSRMSMNWGESSEHSRTGSASSRRHSESSDTAELNQSIAQTLAQVSSSSLFNASLPPSLLQGTAPKTKLSEDKILKNLERPSQTTRRPEHTFFKKDTKTTIVEKQPTAKNQAELEKAPSVVSLTSSTLQGRDDRLADEVSISMTSATATPMINGDPTVTANNSPKPTEDIVNTERKDNERTISTSFGAEPADRIPSELTHHSSKNHSYHDEDSTDPEELWKKEERHELDKKKRRAQSKEMKSTKKLVESQKRKDPELKEKKALPEIKKRDRSESEKRRSVKEKDRTKDGGKESGHSHNGGENCRCEDIREDPKLKTKVCSIQ